MHPKRIFEGVRRGVEHGGNKTGVPTVNGCIVFDERYLGRPLVYCGTGGTIPAKINGKPSEKKEVKEGYLAVMVGGRIGKDGIHGATFSSMQMDEHSPATAVQIGDPITQRKMYDFLLEARDAGLYSAITDNGAGGLSSSLGEMAQLSGGCEIDLEKAPLKYPGLDPWEILLSEAQERMSVAVEPEKSGAFLKLAKERSVEATVVGKFTSSGFFHVKYDGKTAAFLNMEFLHNGLPQMKLEAKWGERSEKEPKLTQPTNLESELLSLLSSYDICSKEYVVRQYDHEVGGGSCVKPLSGAQNDGPSDAGVVRPILSSQEGLVISNGICPRYSDFDTYDMASCAFDEAVRNAVCTGADPSRIAILDNFCWPDPVKGEKTPDGEYKLSQLVRACKALYDCSLAYSVPCISGKDSMKNDFWSGGKKISILPTLLFSALGYIADVSKAVTIDFKGEGESIYLLGMTRDELGGSEYFSLRKIEWGKAPKVNAREFALAYAKLHEAMQKGIISSAHDCSDGGLAVAAAESAFAGEIGAQIDLRKLPYEGEKRNDFLLFSESAGRIIISVKKGKEAEFEEIMRESSFAKIGKTTNKEKLIITGIEG
ncbi:phosphoribosylformylglycinamidine synthase, partial [Candidatus Micrarchaeota archaeon CG11_big_fil_rev_8_21_14_0_20_47_5]